MLIPYRYAPFAYDAWTHPETLNILSKIAGVELVPEMNYEIGHINFSVKSEQQTQQERAEIENQKKLFAEDEGIAGCPWENDKPVVGWHQDSYPFVCVLMLSDCTDMVGGETALRTGDGSIIKVRGPDMVCRQLSFLSHSSKLICIRVVPLFSKAGTSPIKPCVRSAQGNVSPV